MSATEDISLDPIIFDLRDTDPAVRAQAATVLGLSGNPMVVEYLMSTLAFDQDLQVKRSAAIGLGNLGHPSGLQPLLLAIQSPDAELRTFASEAIAKINVPEAVDILVLALQGQGTMQLGALEALAMIGDPRALSAVQTMPPSVDPQVETMRQRAITVMTAPTGDGRDVLMAQLSSNESHQRALAIDALAARGPAELPHVLKALDDADPYVRARAAGALASFGDPVAVEPLIAHLSDADALVRSAVAEALAELGDPRAIPALSEAIDRLQGDSSTTEMVDALGRLTEEAIG